MTDNHEVVGTELPNRERIRWGMEVYQGAPLAEAEEPSLDGKTPQGFSDWILAGSQYEDRDRAVSTLAFHERKHPENHQRLVRIEVRMFVEDVSDEELQKWHDIAAKGDAEKAAQ